MEIKPHEIVLVVVATLAPIVFLVMGFIPGGLNWVGDLVMDPVLRPWVFFGGAAILFAVLAFRIYRRIRPAAKKPAPEATPHVSPTHMPKVTLRRPDGASGP